MLLGCASGGGSGFVPLHLASTADYVPGVAADLYLPDGAASAPLVVMVPGGAWVRSDRSGLGPLADQLASGGAVVVNATHRPAADGNRFPAPLLDVLCSVDVAVTWARAAGIEPTPVIVLGHSSGAHLASLAALAADQFPRSCPAPPARIDAFVGLAGLYDVFDVVDVATPLFGASPADDPEGWRDGDPTTWVSQRPELPVFLGHGEADQLVPEETTHAFAEALRTTGREVRVQIVSGAGHDEIYAPDVIAGALQTWIDSLSVDPQPS